MGSYWKYRVLVLSVVLLTRLAGAQPSGLEGYQVVRITISDTAQLEILERLAARGSGFEIWSDGIGVGEIDARVPPAQKPALDASGLSYVWLRTCKPTMTSCFVRRRAGTSSRRIAATTSMSLS